MTKNEFLSMLRGRITGRIPTSEVESQIDYYSAYIDGRIGSGLTEEEAVAELGDPQLIAKTVIESTDRIAEDAGYDGPYMSSTDTYAGSDGINAGIFGNAGPDPYHAQSGSGSGRSYSQERDYSEGGSSGQETKKKVNFGSSLGCIIAVIIFILIMALCWILFSFVFRVSFALLGWFFPVIAVAAVIFLIFRLSRRK